MPLQPTDQPRDIESPTHDPEDVILQSVATQQIIQKGMVGSTFVVGDQFDRADARRKAGRLLFDAQASTMEPTWCREPKEPELWARIGQRLPSAAGPLATGEEAEQDLADGSHQVTLELLEHVHVHMEGIVGLLNDAISRGLIDRQLVMVER